MSKAYKEKAPERKERGAKMMLLFEEHWNTHPDKKCESCGVQLCGDNLTLYHDHLLEKSIYEEFQFEMDNLMLVCWPCHNRRHAGDPTEKHQLAIEAAKKQFLNGQNE